MMCAVMGSTVCGVVLDLQLLKIGLQSHSRLAVENLLLRKQLALYVERNTKPRRAGNATRLTLVILTRFIDWRPVLTIVQPTPSNAGTATRFGCSGVGSLARLPNRRMRCKAMPHRRRIRPLGVD
jgi:hypothetical protein